MSESIGRRRPVARQRLCFQSEKLRGVVLTAADIFQWQTTGPSACREIFLTRRRAEGDIIFYVARFIFTVPHTNVLRSSRYDGLSRTSGNITARRKYRAAAK